MFKIKMVQALHGDCLILEYGSDQEKNYILIDGGPARVYKDHLKGELEDIRKSGGKINLAVLSHIDDDHVKGLLDLLHDLVKQRQNGQQETIAIAGLWHNSTSQTIEKGATRQLEASLVPQKSMPRMNKIARSFDQGSDLAAYARGLSIPINAEFRDSSDRLVSTYNVSNSIQMSNLSIRVLGPTRETLQALQQEWKEWLDAQNKVKALPADEMKTALRALDQSVPNLSSIMLLVEADGKSILLAGDGSGNQLVEGLQQSGVNNTNGIFHVNIFKLPHHGSARNVTPEVFERITADTYVICANGKYKNPDYQTLEWLVLAAKKQGRSFTIIATNGTSSITKMMQNYNPDTCSYKVSFIQPTQHAVSIDLT